MSAYDRARDPNDPALRETAARWIVRRDRGFTPAESVEFERWLQADPRHAAAIERSALAWGMLDRAPESATVLPAAEPVRSLPAWRWPALTGLAAAVVLGGFFLSRTREVAAPASRPEIAQLAPASPSTAQLVPDTQVLPDGTIVRLGSDSQVIEEFTAAERCVRLVRGEATFTVTKDPQRPFLVQAGDVVVRAVGTTFNVQLQAQAVAVLVAEGTVQVTQKPAAVPATPEPTPESPFVEAGHRAVVTLAETPKAAHVVVSALPPAVLAEALAQREQMLRLTGATLAELVAEFGRRTGTRVVIVDSSLQTLRIGGRFRGDDLEGFVRVLESSYGIQSERAADGSLLLGKRRAR